jgi:ZIP family zinc transporter
LVLGRGFAANMKAGLLLTIALTLEILFLTLSLTLELVKEGSSQLNAFATASFVVLLVPVGLFAADRVALLPQSTVTGFFAFSLIALLYLVTEELLAEAHETPDRPWVTALFFVGFLLLLALEDLIG